MSERRSEPRLPASIPFHVVRGSHRTLCKLVDVSRNGLFFATDATFHLRSLLKLEFAAGGQKIVALGVVVRRGSSHGIRGTAVRFFAESKQMKQIWPRFLEELQMLRGRGALPGWLVTGQEQYMINA